MSTKTGKRTAKKRPKRGSAATLGRLRPIIRRAKREGWGQWIVRDGDEQALLAGYRIVLSKAEFVAEFFRRFLKHSKGRGFAGEPFELLPWQYHDIIVPAFGWIHKDTGLRRIKTVYVEVPKKNGKSTLGAGIGLFLLVADGEPGAEVYSAATKHAQAGLIHDEAVEMVRKSTGLLRRLRINESTKVLSCRATGSKYQALARDSVGAEGLNISGLILDEMHVWTDRRFYYSLIHGGASRLQPFTLIVTTAGEDDPTSIGSEEHDRAVRFLAGDHTDMRYHAVMYGAKIDDDYTDPKVLAAANPSLPAIIRPAEILEEAKDAKQRPMVLNTFLRYRLDIWVSIASPWLDMAAWDRCADPDFDEEQLRGRPCYGGLDMSTKLDLVGLVWVFPAVPADPFVRVVTRIWCPRLQAERRSKSDKVKYQQWGREGHLRLFQTDVVDFRVIIDQIALDRDKFRIQRWGLGYDPWQAEFPRQELDPEAEYMVEYGQNFKDMTGPTKEVETLVRTDGLRHDGNPVFRWTVANVKIIEDTNGNVRPSKKASREKIDPAVAFIMGVGRMLRGDSVDAHYETNELLVLE